MEEQQHPDKASGTLPRTLRANFPFLSMEPDRDSNHVDPTVAIKPEHTENGIQLLRKIGQDRRKGNDTVPIKE